ncbi:MAG: hypothetical protein H0S79_12265 [Anaerolineaceae bacterium]|nr:hypothetical protein [Anaerolineaceae bacterium]
MKRTRTHKKLEAGQALPLIILLMLVVVGMVALILDGGDVMSNRRTAQAAADAGALAGSQRVCAGFSDGKTVAEAYATTNGATTAEATVVGTSVTVDVLVQNPSFFGRFFGQDTLTASATASAGCYGVSGKSVVPLAWRCLPPDGEGPYNPDYGCKMQTLSWPDQLKPLLAGQTVSISNFTGTHVADYYINGTNIVDSYSSTQPPEQIYIVITEDKICFEDSGDPNDIKCDIDGDGKKDIKTGGDRGWLYLTADTSNISDWVDDGPHPDITLEPHVWLSGKSGVETDVYIKMDNSGFQGAVVLIPIYNTFCTNSPLDDPSCIAAAHASPPWPLFTGVDDFSEIKNQSPYYHIVAFAPFYVSCVNKLGNCPGLQYAASLDPNLDDKTPVIEGFFLSDFDVQPDIDQGCVFDIGNCVVSLSD